jgi:tetratricopeptide (TPR) repeat protein
MGLEDYFQLDGMVYRLVPIKTNSDRMEPGRVNTRILYDNLMNKFQWGNMDDPGVYLNEDHRRLTVSFRNVFQRLARTLLTENKPDSAIAALDKAMEVMPEYNIPYNYFTLLIAESYYEAGAYEKANDISKRMLDIHEDNLIYYFSFPESKADLVFNSKRESLTMIQQISFLADLYGQEDLAEQSDNVFSAFYDSWINR